VAISSQNPFWSALLESERLNVKNNTTYAILRCFVHQLASLGRHAQLTRCFSAVAELLVYFLTKLNKSAAYRSTVTTF